MAFWNPPPMSYGAPPAAPGGSAGAAYYPPHSTYPEAPPSYGQQPNGAQGYHAYQQGGAGSPPPGYGSPPPVAPAPGYGSPAPQPPAGYSAPIPGAAPPPQQPQPAAPHAGAYGAFTNSASSHPPGSYPALNNSASSQPPGSYPALTNSASSQPPGSQSAPFSKSSPPQPPGPYPDQQQPPGSYPSQQPPPGSYPSQQQPPGSYPSQPQAYGSYPAQPQAPGSYPAQQPPPGSYPAAYPSTAPPHGYMPPPPTHGAYPPLHGYPAAPPPLQGFPAPGYPAAPFGYPGYPLPAMYQAPPAGAYPQHYRQDGPRYSPSPGRSKLGVKKNHVKKPKAKAAKEPQAQGEPLKPGMQGEAKVSAAAAAAKIAAAAETPTTGLTPRQKSDIKEAEFKARREANPEPTREAQPLQLLRERASKPEEWKPFVEDVHLRSWMYIKEDPVAITWADYNDLYSKIDWRELSSPSGNIMRKTMWFTKEGCTCPYNYGQECVAATPMPSWFRDMMRRWLQSLNLSDDGDKDARFPDCCNLNLYENSAHNVAWHSDDEPLFQGKEQDARIISVSFGGSRRFEIGKKAPRRGGILKPEKGSEEYFNLLHGNICTMEGLFQKHFLHQIKKGGGSQPRVNATFRYIVQHHPTCALKTRW